MCCAAEANTLSICPASGPRSLRRGHLQSFSDCRADGPPNRNRLPAPFRPPADCRRFLVELRIGSSPLAISAKQAHDSRHYAKQEADCVAPTADFFGRWRTVTSLRRMSEAASHAAVWRKMPGSEDLRLHVFAGDADQAFAAIAGIVFFPERCGSGRVCRSRSSRPRWWASWQRGAGGSCAFAPSSKRASNIKKINSRVIHARFLRYLHLYFVNLMMMKCRGRQRVPVLRIVKSALIG